MQDYFWGLLNNKRIQLLIEVRNNYFNLYICDLNVQTMQYLFYLVLIISLYSCNQSKLSKVSENETSISRDTLIGIKGFEKAIILAPNSYKYTNSSVNITPDGTGIGEDIKVDNTTIKNEDAFTFYGIYKRLVFIDNGTSPNNRELVIYDLDAKNIVYRTLYESEISLTNNIIKFIHPIDLTRVRLKKPIKCPEQSKWKNSGLSIGYGADTYLNLETMQDSSAEEMTCFPMQ
jgi:hypothetical protein